MTQALYASRHGNRELAVTRLLAAEKMLAGWTGMYSKIAMAHIVLNQEDAAVHWIKKGITENAKWSVNLPAFYFLRNHPDLKGLIDSESFSSKDWQSAMMMLSNLGRENDVIEIGEMLVLMKKESAYSNFLLGRSYFYEKQNSKALKYLQKSLNIDAQNVEAINLKNKIEKGK